MSQPDHDSINLKLRVAENAAAPRPEESHAKSRWSRSGAHWPPERQLEFNRAVIDLLRAFSEHAERLETRLQQLQTGIAEVDTAARREIRDQIQQVMAENRARLQEVADEQQARIEEAINEQRERLQDVVDKQQEAIQEVTNEQRERIHHVLDEQRVCMRQLALQSSEQAVLADRARRATELRLDDLSKRMDQLGSRPAA